MPWPEHGRNLIPGVNDTWNDFQRRRKGKKMTSAEWKAAREVLYAQYEEFIANGGVPSEEEEITCRSVVFGFPLLNP
jgi:hypothetical protein